MRCSSCRDELTADAPHKGIGGEPVCDNCAADEACAAATGSRNSGATPTVWVITVENDADAVFEVHVFSSFAAAKHAAVELSLSWLDEDDAVDRTDVDACIEAAQAHGATVTLHERVVQTAFDSEGLR